MKWSKYFQNLSMKVIGVGITAFNRVAPAYLLRDYEIICYKDSWDVDEIAKKCRVTSVRGDLEVDLKRLNSLAILKHPRVQKHLQRQGKIGLFLYKSTPKIEKVANQHGWQVLTNPSEIRDPYENKKIFREVLEKVGVEAIPARTLAIKDFDEHTFEEAQRQYGPKLILQLPEVTKGGGRGNTFLNKQEELRLFWEKVKRLGESFKIKNVIVAKFIKGISPSITGCVTRHGVLTGVVQTQITDIPEVVNLGKGAGLFVGHDWSYRHYSGKIQGQAERIAKRFGEYIYKQGYKGIFGIDLLVEEETDKVYACECNPRYTGAFPVYSMIQIVNGEPPFDVFQLLEYLNIDYSMEFERVDRLYKQKKEGSHLILFNRADDYLEVRGKIRGGVYKFGSKLEFLRPGFALQDIKNQEEFVLTDGTPKKGAIIRPGLRILKIIFPHAILAPGAKAIDERTRLIVSQIYQSMDLKPIKLKS